MGLFPLTITGGGLVLIGACEALTCYSSSSSSTSSQSTLNHSPSLPSPLNSAPASIIRLKSKRPTSVVSITTSSLLSFFIILNSFISLSDAHKSNDPIGSLIQYEIISVSLLFLLYSILCFLTHFTHLFSLPAPILNVICVFAFFEELLLFFLQRKDTSGIENRYFLLLCVPITVCIVSMILELKNPKAKFPRLACGVGLILQGTWFIQMGFSFYTNAMAHGCSLHEKSRGNYTLKCNGHPEYHRGRAIATLQFNCHLALMVVLIVGSYMVIWKKNGYRDDFMRYKTIGAEMQHLESHAQFTLDSDDEDDGDFKEVDHVDKQKRSVEMGINGHGSHA
ncbi:Protein of unknown function DUF716 [Dillenia turbinata]|uniref:Uncharacterized protein n=1 Tax=Dillenia turbinata TaxID=194707 RepID=A0AAN8VIH0_9MAGN